MKKRTMISVLRVLNNISYPEAMKELKAEGNPKASLQRTPFGYKIGIMGWKSPEQEYKTEVPTYNPNNGNVVELSDLAAMLS